MTPKAYLMSHHPLCRAWLLEELLCLVHAAAASTTGAAAASGVTQAAQLLLAAVEQLEGQNGQKLLDGLLDR